MLAVHKPLNQGSVRLIQSIKSGRGIVFITARPEYVRNATCAWIEKHFPGIGDYALFMRQPDMEGVSAVEIKRKVIIGMLADGLGNAVVRNAYDDRNDIVLMYASMGID